MASIQEIQSFEYMYRRFPKIMYALIVGGIIVCAVIYAFSDHLTSQWWALLMIIAMVTSLMGAITIITTKVKWYADRRNIKLNVSGTPTITQEEMERVEESFFSRHIFYTCIAVGMLGVTIVSAGLFVQFRSWEIGLLTVAALAISLFGGFQQLINLWKAEQAQKQKEEV